MSKQLSAQAGAEVKIGSCELSLGFREPGEAGAWHPDPDDVNGSGKYRKNQRLVGGFCPVPGNVMRR